MEEISVQEEWTSCLLSWTVMTCWKVCPFSIHVSALSHFVFFNKEYFLLCNSYLHWDIEKAPSSVVKNTREQCWHAQKLGVQGSIKYRGSPRGRNFKVSTQNYVFMKVTFCMKSKHYYLWLHIYRIVYSIVYSIVFSIVFTSVLLILCAYLLIDTPCGVEYRQWSLPF